MAITEVYELDGVTVGASELSIVSGTTTLQNIADDGVYQLWVDPGAMAKGDLFRVRGYEKVEATGGTKRVFFEETLQGAQPQNFVIPSFVLMHAWDFTIQKVTGTDRAFDASIRRIANAGITEPYELDNVTVGVTELSVVSGTTSLQTVASTGVYQLWIDQFTMAKGDEFTVRCYEKVEATGGTKKKVFEQKLLGAATKLYVSPALTLMHGWDFTIQRDAGADRAFDASIRKLA